MAKNPSKRNVEDFPNLDSEYYETIERGDYVRKPKERLKTIALVKDKKSNNELKIRFIDKWVLHKFAKGKKSDYYWSPGKSFNIQKDDDLSMITRILRWLGKLMGKTDDDYEELILQKESVEKLSEELLATKSKLKSAQLKAKQLEKELEKREEDFKRKRDAELKSKIPQLKGELSAFRTLLDDFEKEKKVEEDLQKYLEKHPWFLGLYYHDFIPQKTTGMGRFDFYLKRFDNSAEIIELKRADAIFLNADNKISKGFAEAIDQMLRYFDDVLAISSSTRMSKHYGINEFYPRGILVFGYKPNEDVQAYINKWRYALKNIEIQTYDQILQKAETTIKNLEKS